MKRVIFIILYIGNYPWYFLYFLKSCTYNPDIDFKILSDADIPLSVKPDNVELIPYSLEQFNEDATKALGFKINVEKAYKLCDFKPAYGYIFSDYVKNYDFWGYCATMHKRVEKFLQETDGDACVQYIFSSLQPDLDFANKYLVAAYLQKEYSEFERIIADWFEKGKPLREAFFNDLELNIEDSQVESEFQKHEAWKEKTQMRATPVILVNGYKLPDNYKIEDLKYFTKIEK